MPFKKQYNLFLLLFPFIYLIHNLEEWIVFRVEVKAIMQVILKNFTHFLPDNPLQMVSAFGMALMFATIIPAIITIYIWGKFTTFNAKVLIIVAFVTLINAISHITSSFVLGFISPGLITGILLCIPYSVTIIHFIRKHFRFTLKQSLLFGLISVALFVFGIAFSWSIGLIAILL